MKKKIAVQDLQRGMYVSELVGRHWRETPFLFQGFEFQADEQIEEIRSLLPACLYRHRTGN